MQLRLKGAGLDCQVGRFLEGHELMIGNTVLGIRGWLALGSGE
jgi:hypothetical protein